MTALEGSPGLSSVVEHRAAVGVPDRVPSTGLNVTTRSVSSGESRARAVAWLPTRTLPTGATALSTRTMKMRSALAMNRRPSGRNRWIEAALLPRNGWDHVRARLDVDHMDPQRARFLDGSQPPVRTQRDDAPGVDGERIAAGGHQRTREHVPHLDLTAVRGDEGFTVRAERAGRAAHERQHRAAVDVPGRRRHRPPDRRR